MLAVLLQGSDFLELFLDACDVEGCEDTALNWVIAAVVVAIVCALVVLGAKWFWKSIAPTIVEKAWSRGQTIVLFIVGLLPVLLVLMIIWYRSRNFFNYVGIGGLLKGIVFSWLLYVFLALAGHQLTPWRREIL